MSGPGSAGPQAHGRLVIRDHRDRQGGHRQRAVYFEVGDGRASSRRRGDMSRRARTLPWLIGAPVLAVLFYGIARIVMSLLVQIREGMFARVAMHAVRKLALSTFEHMHRLSLRFHLERKTGGLTRVLERVEPASRISAAWR